MTVLLAYAIVALVVGVPVTILLCALLAAIVDQGERRANGRPYSPLTLLLLLALLVAVFAGAGRFVRSHRSTAAPAASSEVP